MKRITVMLMMFSGLFISCTADDQLLMNESNVVPAPETQAAQAMQDEAGCFDSTALNGTAILSSYDGLQIAFNWNNNIEHSTDMTYVSYLEITEDANCPTRRNHTPVARSLPIDVFNTSSLVLPEGLSAKCFYWRIVVNVYADSELECTSATNWMGATYVVD
jgi:hypothetical protein